MPSFSRSSAERYIIREMTASRNECPGRVDYRRENDFKRLYRIAERFNNIETASVREGKLAAYWAERNLSCNTS